MNVFLLSNETKRTFIEVSCTNNIHTDEKGLGGFAAATSKGLWVVSIARTQTSIPFFQVKYRILRLSPNDRSLFNRKYQNLQLNPNHNLIFDHEIKKLKLP